MRVLLVHPNKYAQRYVSVGIAMISAVLRKAGHEIIFIDTSRFREEGQKNNTANSLKAQTKKMEEALQFMPVELPPIEKSNEFVVNALHSIIQSFEPGLIGFTATSSDFPYTTSLIKQIKHYRIPTIVGGAHSIVAPLEVLAVDGVDMVCVSEGEEAIIELADSLESGKARTDIQNIYFKTSGNIIKNNIRPYVNLNSLAIPDLEIFDKYHHIGAYQGEQVVYGRFETGRGCPYKCAYCINERLHSLHHTEKKHVRYKSPERVIKELKLGMEKIGVDIFRFVDETFLATPIDRLEEFVHLYRSEIDKPMIIATRPETVNYKTMSILRDACENIQVTMGIESGSEDIRKRVCNRFVSNDTIISAFHICRDLGFHTGSFNMIGLPDETREDFLQTINVNREAKVDTPMLSFFYPFPGTKLRNYCINKGYINNDCYEVDYAVSSVLKMPQFTIEEMEGLKRTFVLYVKMDEPYFPKVHDAELDDSVFQQLSQIYRQQYFSKTEQLSN
jgi:radical SAM superfamily enzyme YgiQ (UPF0313 family)